MIKGQKWRDERPPLVRFLIGGEMTSDDHGYGFCFVC
jgi:hypothetical protein